MSKAIKYSPEDWIKKISEDLGRDYQMGLHQVGVFGTDESKKAVRRNNPLTYLRKIRAEDYCESIMKTGLLNRWEDISLTLWTFGSVEGIINSNLLQEDFLNYEYKDVLEDSSKELYDVVVAVPSRVTVDEKNFYFGHLANVEDYTAKPEMSMGRRIFKGTNIPKEFIYGYIYKHNGVIEFTANPQYIDMKSMEDKDKFYRNFIQEKQLLPTEEEVKMQSKSEVENMKTKKGPVEAYKKFLTNRLKSTLSILQEKEEITKRMSTSIIPYKKFNFLQKYLFKRKEYKEYVQDVKNAKSEQTSRMESDRFRLKEIERILVSEGFQTTSSIEKKIEEIERAQSFQELRIDDINLAIETLIENGINPEFESYEQAFEMAPEYLGKDIEFMKKAIVEDPKFIMFDKTEDEELYRQVIDMKIEKLEKQLSQAEKYDYVTETELDMLRKYKQELELPKAVEDGKYKVPHRFMFEEIRNNAIFGNKDYWYIRSRWSL